MADDQSTPAAVVSLTRPQKKELGLLPRDLMRYSIQAKADGIDLRSLSADEQAAVLIGYAIDAKPEAWAKPGIDFEAIKEFIEWFLPILLQFLAIFGAV